MRFSDIKKFWENYLGGHTSRISNTDKNKAQKTNNSATAPNKHGRKCQTDRSLESPTSQEGHTTTEKDATHAHKSQASCEAFIIHNERPDAIVSKATGDQNSERHSVPRLKGNNSKYSAESNAVPGNAPETEGRDINQTKTVKSASGKAQSFNRPKELKIERYILRSSTVPNLIGLFTSSSKNESKKADSQAIEQISVTNLGREADCHKSDQNLSIVRAGSKSFADSASAPPSLNASPLRKITNGKLQSNVKFNEVHNFWQMKEKILVKRSVQERRCIICDCYLNNYFYEQDGALYCEDDYWNKFGHHCMKCNGIITGPIMIAGVYRFHPECFECKCCKQCVSDGEFYALVLSSIDKKKQTSLLFCIVCYQGLFSQNENCQGLGDDGVKCKVIMVVDYYPTLSIATGTAGNSNCARGYGITVRDLPITMQQDGTSQPAGQVVVGVDDVIPGSLQTGDQLLQVNGLVVDLNALDLIDRLHDDSKTALQMTVQRDVTLPLDILSHSQTCSHMSTSPKHHFNYNSSTQTQSPSEAQHVVKCQPSNPLGLSQQQSLLPKNLLMVVPCSKASETEGSVYCNPFAFPTSNTLCCASGAAPTALARMENNDKHENVIDGDEESYASSDNLVDSGVEEDNDECFNDSEQASPSDSRNDIKDCESTSANTSEETISIENNFETNTKTRSDVIESSEDSQDISIIKQSPSASSPDIDVINDSLVACSQPDKIEINSPLSITVKNNADSRNTVSTNDKESVTAKVSNNSDLPPISPRVKRLGVKRKKSRIEQLRDGFRTKNNVSDKKQMEILVEDQGQERRKRDHARRSNSLRTDMATVIMRNSSPRAEKQKTKSTYSLQNHTEFDAYHQCNIPGNMTSDLSRSESMRIYSTQMDRTQRVFRPCDLILGDILGQGFFGRAIKVTHRDTGEVMVMKELNTLDEQTEKSFLQEVKVLRNLYHPNVLHFIGVLYKGRRLNIITQFIECGSLKDLIGDIDKTLSWQYRVRIAKDISCGMKYLHSKNIIHRDLNSGNCFVKKNGTVVVADFGLARVLSNQTASLGRKKRYTVVGSPYWMAPEMLYRNVYDEKVDVFSFGIVLCEIIGRVEADPTYLPRSNDFGLAVLAYHSKFCGSCPAFYFAIAVHASRIVPDDRPSFDELETWFGSVAMREELPHLPEPPHLHEVIVSVYEQYDLALPEDLYIMPNVPEEDESEEEDLPVMARSSSVISVGSQQSSPDADAEHNRRSRRSTVRGTGFYVTPSVATKV